MRVSPIVTRALRVCYKTFPSVLTVLAAASMPGQSVGSSNMFSTNSTTIGEVDAYVRPGSTGFMLVCAMLVFTDDARPGVLLRGLSRRKNVVNTMIMSFAVIGIVGVTWTVCGWSFAYGGDGSIPFFGGFDQIRPARTCGRHRGARPKR